MNPGSPGAAARRKGRRRAGAPSAERRAGEAEDEQSDCDPFQPSPQEHGDQQRAGDDEQPLRPEERSRRGRQESGEREYRLRSRSVAPLRRLEARAGRNRGDLRKPSDQSERAQQHHAHRHAQAGDDRLRSRHAAADRHRADGFHRLHGHRDAEREPREDIRDAGEDEDRAGVEPDDLDHAHGDRDECPKSPSAPPASRKINRAVAAALRGCSSTTGARFPLRSPRSQSEMSANRQTTAE